MTDGSSSSGYSCEVLRADFRGEGFRTVAVIVGRRFARSVK